mgnify:CR=1 FL=1|tara:strand:- start:35205 stop:35405 length:201 start_codon:yes stop_codon:yes gene_type:complete
MTDIEEKYLWKLQAENRLLTQFMNYIINSVRNSGPEGFTVTPEQMERLMEDYYGKIGEIRFGITSE